ARWREASASGMWANEGCIIGGVLRSFKERLDRLAAKSNINSPMHDPTCHAIDHAWVRRNTVRLFPSSRKLRQASAKLNTQARRVPSDNQHGALVQQSRSRFRNL